MTTAVHNQCKKDATPIGCNIHSDKSRQRTHSQCYSKHLSHANNSSCYNIYSLSKYLFTCLTVVIQQPFREANCSLANQEIFRVPNSPHLS